MPTASEFEAKATGKTPYEERRIKQALIHPEEILCQFLSCPFESGAEGEGTNWVTRRLAGELEGVSVASVNYDPMRQGFVFTLASPSFPVVPFGDYPPWVPMEFRIVKLAIQGGPIEEKSLAGA